MSQPEKLQKKVAEVTDNFSAGSFQLPDESKIRAGDQKQKSTIVVCIILNFISIFPSPSIKSIFEKFEGYGIYKPETRFINNATAQVVFLHKDGAKIAYTDLKNNNPFGHVLGSYHLTPLLVSTTDNKMPTPFGMISEKSMNQLNRLQLDPPPGFPRRHATNQPNGLLDPPPGFPRRHATKQLDGLLAPPPGFPQHSTNKLNMLLTPPPGFPQHPMNQFNGLATPPVTIPHNKEPPNLLAMKQKLEEMSFVMEKDGSKLSPEIRSELESGIKNMTKRIKSLIRALS